jgi:hypothetical protein
LRLILFGSKNLISLHQSVCLTQFRLFKMGFIGEKRRMKFFQSFETLGSTIFGDFCGAGSAGTSQKCACRAAIERSGDGLLMDSFVAQC